MKVECWAVGKTQEKYLKTGIEEYVSRLKHYWPFIYLELNISIKEVFKKIEDADILILLDEKGKHFSSIEFAGFLEKIQHSGGKRMIFLIGDAYGFDQILYKRAQHILSLSSMTFTHQMVRLIFLEQFYRAMTILKNESYHNP